MPILQLHAPNLFLDLGTKMGWAVLYPDGRIISGVERFTPGRFEGGGMRFLKLTSWLVEIKNTLGAIESIHFEEVRMHAGVDAAHAYGGYMGHLTAWCEKNDIPYAGVHVGQIKKSATGKGNANKEAMIEAMKDLGHNPEDDNEADALALLYCVTGGKSQKTRKPLVGVKK